MAWNTLLATIVVGLISGLAYLGHAFYKHRSKINRLRKLGIPMSQDWNWITGHLLTLQKYRSKFPSDAYVMSSSMLELSREFSTTEAFLLDVWPVYPPLLIVSNPEMANQISTKFNLPKSDTNSDAALKPIVGGPSMISMGGEEWKYWRSLFNPGFSASNMAEFVPHIVECAQVFCEKLEEMLCGGVFRLEELTARLTTDVIVKVTLDADLEYQRHDHPLPRAFDTIVKWHSMWNPLVLMNPLRPLIQKYYGNAIDDFVRKQLELRFSELKAENEPANKSKRTKSVVRLALEGYIAENDSKGIAASDKLDDTIAKYVGWQLRLFLFAGNDTTSGSIVQTYHLLSQHPEALRKLRAEHDKMFGTDTSRAVELLKEKPALLNQCRYTMAVIKETLRLAPPAGTLRTGRHGVVLTDHLNNSYPMDDIATTIIHAGVHLNPRVWARPSEFLPERWLVDADHELYPDPTAYRPFEQGPRNCIGQTLVHNEMRIVLILTARRFMIMPAYEEWDRLQAGKDGWARRLGKFLGVVGADMKTVYGDRAYLTDTAGTHPKDGYPCRVERIFK